MVSAHQTHKSACVYTCLFQSLVWRYVANGDNDSMQKKYDLIIAGQILTLLTDDLVIYGAFTACDARGRELSGETMII